MDKILFVIWFFLPAALANSTAVIAAKLPIIKNWDYPMDFYLSYKGKRILGSHKTIRGLVSGVLMAITIVYLQKYVFFDSSANFTEIDYLKINFLDLGLLMGIGALIGDAVKSFFKRRINIKPGGAWFPFDQIDFILGSSLFTYLYLPLPVSYYVYYLLLGIIAHLITNVSAYLLGIKEVPY